MGTSHILRVQQPYVANGYHTGQCRYRAISSVWIVQLAILNDSFYLPPDPLARGCRVSRQDGESYGKKKWLGH